MSKQDTGLLVFKRIWWGRNSSEQRVTAPVVLTVLNQVCCCQWDLLGQRTTWRHFTTFFIYIFAPKEFKIFTGHYYIIWIMKIYKKISPILHLTTDFQLVTYLNPLHACLESKLIHKLLCLNNTGAAAAHLSWYCPSSKNSVKVPLCGPKAAAGNGFSISSIQKVSCAGESGEAISWLSFMTCTTFLFAAGAVQRLCDIKGHTTQSWKCHKHHTALHSQSWWKDYWLGQYFLCFRSDVCL